MTRPKLPKSRKPRPWELFHRHVIHDGKSVYLDRISLIITPFFSIKLHRIHRPDQQRDLHDHPWDFLSLVLFGHYVEDTPEGLRRRRWWNWKRAEGRHSIREVSRKPVWTFLFCGPRRRKWGFWVAEKWIPWDRYEKLLEA